MNRRNIYNEEIKKECPYCGEVIEGKHSVFANHVRWCKDNPDHERIVTRNIESNKISRNKIYGEFRDFEVECCRCHKKFTVREREKLFPTKQKYYCSRSCANAHIHSEETKAKISGSVKKTIQYNISHGIIQNTGYCIGGSIGFKFNEGKHETWDNKIVYLRSSYELEYAKHLDQLNILYEVEKIRISYFDSKLNKYRFSIPDFYLPLSNTIVEVKSEFTYDKENMLSKVQRYIELGYNIILVLDHEEYDIQCIDDLPDQKMNMTIYDV